METARGLARIVEDRLAAVAHHRPRVVGRRRVGPARIDRVGGEARRRAEAEGRRLHQHRRHRQRLAERRRIARPAAVHGRGREGRHGSAHRQAGLRGSAPPRGPRRAGRRIARRRKPIRRCARAARIGIGLHAVPAAPDAVGVERGLRRREPGRRVSLGLRHHQVVPDLFGHRLQLRPHALAADRHADPSPRRCAGAAVPVHRHRRHAAALRRRAREARRRQEGFEGRHETGSRRRRGAARPPARVSRRPMRRSARRIRRRCSRRRSFSS